MGDRSGIEWTEATWNPVTGCTKVSEGCKNCYAERQAHRLQAMGSQRYADGFKVTMHPDVLTKPLGWRRPRKIFVNSMSDLFHPDVPDEFIAEVFGVMRLASHHVFQVLTKRPERMKTFLSQCGRWDGWMTHDGTAPRGAYNGTGIIVGDADRWPLPNVWMGVSVENQRRADERIPLLLQTPAQVRFLSCEPLLGPLDLRNPFYGLFPEDVGIGDRALDYHLAMGGSEPDGVAGNSQGTRGVHWIIAGGESGPGARPMDIDWARSLRDQCQAAGVPYFFKQVGGARVAQGGHEAALLDGVLWKEMPAV